MGLFSTMYVSTSIKNSANVSLKILSLFLATKKKLLLMFMTHLGDAIYKLAVGFQCPLKRDHTFFLSAFMVSLKEVRRNDPIIILYDH